MLQISCEDKRTNYSILEELSTNRVLLHEIKYVGHAVRIPKQIRWLPFCMDE